MAKERKFMTCDGKKVMSVVNELSELLNSKRHNVENKRKTERLYQSALVHRRRLFRGKFPKTGLSVYACRH